MTTAFACSTARKVTDAALGVGDKEARELERLERAHRAPTLTDAEIEHRLTFLTEQLDDDHVHAAAWQYGWIFVDSAGALASAGQAAFGSSDDRAYFIMRAVKGAIGATYLVLDPQPARHGAEPIREMPSATRSDKINQLIAAENLLAAAAQRSEQRYSWAYHIGNFLFNAAGAGAVAATGDTSHAIQAVFIDTAAGELQVWTQPWEPPSQWEEYQRMVAAEQGTAYTPHARWELVTEGLQVAVRARF